MDDVLKPGTWKAALAELVGTCFLTLTALLSGTPYASALTLTAFVYTIGKVSGCHVNPAVTLGLVSARRLALPIGALYVVAQLAGALVAGFIAGRVGQIAPEYQAGSAFAEFMGFGFLMLTVVAVSEKHVPQAGSGLALGAALAAGLLTSKGVLNPAIAVAMGLTFSAATWAPIVGGILFTACFGLLAPKEASPEEASPQDDSEEASQESSEPSLEAIEATQQQRERLRSRVAALREQTA